MKRRHAILFLIMMIMTIFIANASAQEKKPDAALNQSKAQEGQIAANSDTYIIGPEDVLNIYVWQEQSLTKTVPVRIDGKISIPLVDDVQAAGLTPLKLKDVITEKLKDYMDDPTVTITVMEANSNKVYVDGEVKSPGVKLIRSPTTLMKLIISIGGFTDWANKRKILIITTEGGKEKRITANYNKIADGVEPDIIIKPGDTIIVK